MTLQPAAQPSSLPSYKPSEPKQGEPSLPGKGLVSPNSPPVPTGPYWVALAPLPWALVAYMMLLAGEAKYKYHDDSWLLFREFSKIRGLDRDPKY